MHNAQQPFMGSFPEHNERVMPPVEAELSFTETTAVQTLLGTLLNAGFSWEEAVKLQSLREHLYENSEMIQRVANNYRMHFVRWLYEQGEMSDFS